MDREGIESADAARWAEVEARWDDDAAHRAYLKDLDLEGLGAAGRRYRDALARTPGDPVATRWRDEVLRRAVAQGLARLPRTAPPAARAGSRKLRLAAWAVVGVGLLVTGWAALGLLAPRGGP